MGWIREKTRAEIRARLAAVAPRLASIRAWLETPAKPRTWAELRGKLTTLSLPSTNGGRLVLAAVIVVLLLLLLLVVLPWYARPQPGEKGVATYPHATLLNPILTVAAAVAAGIFALIRHFQTIAADRQRRITETFSKAVEQLASEKMEVRVGGIYTLERLAGEALAGTQRADATAEQTSDLYWTVMETLAAFVRERARWKGPKAADKSDTLPPSVTRSDEEQSTPEPATDIAAVLAVIRRRPETGRLREEQREHEWRFDLRATDLRGATLRRAHLQDATLREAQLEGAILLEAHLEGAFLGNAHLKGAILLEAHLEGAILGEAHLEGAILPEAHLEGADLGGAHLEGALGLDKAYGNARTRLPDGVARPAHWPPYDPNTPEPDSARDRSA